MVCPAGQTQKPVLAAETRDLLPLKWMTLFSDHLKDWQACRQTGSRSSPPTPGMRVAALAERIPQQGPIRRVRDLQLQMISYS